MEQRADRAGVRYDHGPLGIDGRGRGAEEDVAGRLGRIRDGQAGRTAKLDAAQEKLKRAYLSKAKAAVDASLAEHKKK